MSQNPEPNLIGFGKSQCNTILSQSYFDAAKPKSHLFRFAESPCDRIRIQIYVGSENDYEIGFYYFDSAKPADAASEELQRHTYACRLIPETGICIANQSCGG